MTAAAPPDLDELVSLSFVARSMKWHRLRVWRHLKRLNKEMDGRLLINVSRGQKPYFLVGWRALRQAFPQAFCDDIPTLTERVGRLEDAVHGLTRADDAIARELGRTRKRLRELRIDV